MMFPIVRAPIKDQTLEEMGIKGPFHGVGVVERVADTDKGDAGHERGEGRMDKTV